MLSFVAHFFQFIFLFSDKLCQHVKSFMRVCEYWKGAHGPESLRKTNKWHFLSVSAENWIPHFQRLFITWKNWMGSSVRESWLSWSFLLLSSSTSRLSCTRPLLARSTPAFSASPTVALISARFLSTERTYKSMCSAHRRSKSSHASHAASL